MHSPKLCLTLALALPLTAAHAAATEHRSETSASAPVDTLLVAALLEPSIPVLPITPSGEHVRPVSAGISESLPDLPSVVVAPLAFTASRELQTSRLNYRPVRTSATETKLPDEPGMLSLVQASPIGGVARRIQAQRFNTDDGVSDDFAICYRFNKHSSLQVIPGDPAPVKIPVSSFANNAGVTVGMVVRLSR